MRWKTAGGIVLGAAVVVGAALLLSQYREQRAQRVREQNLVALEQAYQAKDRNRTVELADTLLADGERCPNRERVLYLKAQAFHDLDHSEEPSVWQMLLKEYPESRYAAEALLVLGRSALEKGEVKKAREYLQTVLEKVPSGPPADEALLALARLEEESGNTGAARERYEQILAGDRSSTVQEKARLRLSEMNEALLFGSGENELNQLYSVELGDKLISIAGKFDTTVELLKRLNPGVGTLHEGELLTVPRRGGLRIEVDKSTLTLSVHSQREGTEGRFLISYPIGLPAGAERQQSGEYRVGSVKNVYSAKEDGSYGTLGSRYIELVLADSGASTSVAFHGTNDPDSIGRIGGVNSIRMHNSDVEELFGLARVGTQVTIE